MDHVSNGPSNEEGFAVQRDSQNYQSAIDEIFEAAEDVSGTCCNYSQVSTVLGMTIEER